MSNEEQGIEQTLKVLDASVEFGNVAANLNSGKHWYEKAAAILPLLDELCVLLSLDMAKLKLEVKDISPVEMDLMMQHVKEKYDIADDKLEGMVEEGLGLGAELLELGLKLKSYSAKWKK